MTPRQTAAARRLLTPTPTAPARTVAGASSANTGTRLGVALLGYMVGITLIVTLLPFRFAVPATFRVMPGGDLLDVIANVVMFVPLGFLFRLSRGTGRWSSATASLIMGTLASVAIEGAQLFEVERVSSPLDVLANGAGAWAGALVHDRVATRLRFGAGMVGRLSLELPLMGLVYLLVPLLWLDGMSDDGSPLRWPLTLLLALFGGSILASMQRHHFGPARRVSAAGMAGAAAAWFLLGALPSVGARPWTVALVAVVVAWLVWVQTADSERALPIDRRFERVALRRAAPLFVAYVALLPLAALADGVGTWSLSRGFAGLADQWGSPEILRLLAGVASFTLLGYMIAELRGRLEEPMFCGAVHVLLWSSAAALFGETLQGFRPGFGASVARLALLLAASLYGAWLYHLQRAHVRQLLDEA